MLKAGAFAIFLAGASAAALWAVRRDTPDYLPAERLTKSERIRLGCGPISLAIAAQLSGRDVPPGALLEQCRYRPEGVDSTELCRLAEEHGLLLTPGKLTWDELLRTPEPTLLHYTRGHFVVANTAEGRAEHPESVRVYDPNGAAKYLSRPELESEWDGHALKVSLKPGSAERPDDVLCAERWWVDAGVESKLTGVAVYEVRLQNRSPHQVTLRVANTSCSCTSAALEQSELPPGAATLLRATVALERKRGPFYERVILAADQSGSTTERTLTLAGTAVDDVSWSQRTLYVGDVHPGDRLAGSIVLRDRGDASLKVTSVKIEKEPQSSGPLSPALECDWKQVGTREDARVIHRHPSVIPSDWLVEIVGRIPQQAECGDVRATLLAVVESGGETRVIRCPVEGRIVPDVKVTPGTVILRPDSPSREVTVTRSDGSPLELEAAYVEDLPGVTSELIRGSGTVPQVVRLTSRPSLEPSGPASGRLRLRTVAGSEYNVPVMVLPRAPAGTSSERPIGSFRS
ncbi:MAG: DUF1573 domain-containing protein [Planctomycetaceae bacterium]|nr:DUF1573 domain-containing protein [Planctomycetaceae bacterium]